MKMYEQFVNELKHQHPGTLEKTYDIAIEYIKID